MSFVFPLAPNRFRVMSSKYWLRVSQLIIYHKYVKHFRNLSKYSDYITCVDHSYKAQTTHNTESLEFNPTS